MGQKPTGDTTKSYFLSPQRSTFGRRPKRGRGFGARSPVRAERPYMPLGTEVWAYYYPRLLFQLYFRSIIMARSWKRIDTARRTNPAAWRDQQRLLSMIRSWSSLSTSRYPRTPSFYGSRRSSIASTASSNVGGMLASYSAADPGFRRRHGFMNMRLLPTTRAFSLDFRRRHRRRNRRLFRRSRR